VFEKLSETYACDPQLNWCCLISTEPLLIEHKSRWFRAQVQIFHWWRAEVLTSHWTKAHAPSSPHWYLKGTVQIDNFSLINSSLPLRKELTLHWSPLLMDTCSSTEEWKLICAVPQCWLPIGYISRQASPFGVQTERVLPPPIVPASKILYKLVIILISTYYGLQATSALRQKSSHFHGINSHSEIFHFLF
jgi:hypothetical protein